MLGECQRDPRTNSHEIVGQLVGMAWLGDFSVGLSVGGSVSLRACLPVCTFSGVICLYWSPHNADVENILVASLVATHVWYLDRT